MNFVEILKTLSVISELWGIKNEQKISPDKIFCESVSFCRLAPSISDRWVYASRFCRTLNSSCLTTANFALSQLSSLNFTIWKSISSSLFPSGRSALAWWESTAAKAFTVSLICCGTASAASRKQHLDPTTRSKSIIWQCIQTVLQLLSQQEKSKERLERGQFRTDDSPWHDCVQFFFW